MNFTNTTTQLNFIIILCFSFSISIFSILIIKEKTLSKLMGLSFTIPFLSIAFAFISKEALLSESLFSLAHTSLFLSLFIILAKKPKAKSHRVISVLITTYPVILLIILSNSDKLMKFIILHQIDTISIILSALPVMFTLRKEKGNRSLIFWASMIILIQSTLEIITDNNIVEYISVICYAYSYSTMMLYFYREIIVKMAQKIKEAEKQMEIVDRNLNLEVRKRVLEIERSNEILVNISKTDSLTKALNKAAILNTIEKLISSDKGETEFSILMFDIDNFKTINDTLGHVVGDKCIKKLSLIAKNSMREVDSLGRYGGDEFIIVLPGANIAQAKLVAERFRKKVEETESPHFTVSIGMASFPQDGSSVKELISSADDGLYHSKRKGRNAVSYRNVL